jgi:hypothetical protein
VRRHTLRRWIPSSGRTRTTLCTTQQQ